MDTYNLESDCFRSIYNLVLEQRVTWIFPALEVISGRQNNKIED
jgi:hypothetical protein